LLLILILIVLLILGPISYWSWMGEEAMGIESKRKR